MVEASQILHVEYNIIVLIIKALNKHGQMKAASKALGMSERHLYRYKAAYSIAKDINGVYRTRLNSETWKSATISLMKRR